jgi:branched-chain amino acid transport system substrate-binding protein
MMDRRRFAVVAASAMVLPSLRAQTSRDIVIGQSAQLTGPFRAYCLEMLAGAALVFEQANREGGVQGRRLRLVSLDDAYDVKKTEANTNSLIDEHGAVSLFLYGGTPTSLAAAKIAEQRQVPFVAPSTGSDALRRLGGRYVFNLRASYGDELASSVKHIASIGLRKVAVVYLNNPFGQGGLEAIEQAAKHHSVELVAKLPMTLEGADAQQVARALAQNPASAVLLVTAGRSGPMFINAYTDQGRKAIYYMMSTTSNVMLRDELGERAKGVIVSQVVPSPWHPTSEVVRSFRQAAAAAGLQEYSFAQMEGYIAARVLVDALRRSAAPIGRESLMAALESTRRKDLGGYTVEFSPSKRNSGEFVDLMILGSNGKFQR